MSIVKDNSYYNTGIASEYLVLSEKVVIITTTYRDQKRVLKSHLTKYKNAWNPLGNALLSTHAP